jgi:uncharacterized protein
MNLTFIDRGPALVVENTQRVLVIADLHFGIESDFARHGVHIPSQGSERVERAIACIEEAEPDLLILLGDVKHSIPITSRQEYRELPKMLSAFRERVPIKVVPGNHDGGLEQFLQNGELLPTKGAVVDGIGYLHGHALPAPELLGRLIILGHLHPMVALQDEVGCALRGSAYLYSELNEECLGMKREDGATRLLFMPAFNELSGYDVMRIQKTALGPIARCMKTDDAEVFLTDGTYLGPIGSLRPAESA